MTIGGDLTRRTHDFIELGNKLVWSRGGCPPVDSFFLLCACGHTYFGASPEVWASPSDDHGGSKSTRGAFTSDARRRVLVQYRPVVDGCSNNDSSRTVYRPWKRRRRLLGWILHRRGRWNVRTFRWRRSTPTAVAAATSSANARVLRRQRSMWKRRTARAQSSANRATQRARSGGVLQSA